MKILVVEDDAQQWQNYERSLRPAGHEVFWASRAITAIDFLRTDQFDLVMLDLELDGSMSGLEVKRHIPRGVHVFVLSGHPAEEVRAAAAMDPLTGVDLYFDKPVDMALLLKSLRVIGSWPTK
jgi:DNA-binding response OmpR family regulator